MDPAKQEQPPTSMDPEKELDRSGEKPKPREQDSQQSEGGDPEKPREVQQSQESLGGEESQSQGRRAAVSPFRLNVIVLGLWISLFLAAIDGTIISTAVFDISNSFNSTSQSAWIVTSYLLTYNAFVLLLAKLSDLVGLKPLLLISNVIFLVFSIACGVSRSIDQLIVFRAFQGIGASGLYCLVFVAILRLISIEKAGLYSGLISSVFALSNLLGPILGGVIVDNTTWRWIFYINIPLASIAILILGCAMPASNDIKVNRQTFRKLDFIGSFLSVCWLIPILFALQEGGSQYSWQSGQVIGTLVGGIAALIAFIAYETWLQNQKDGAREPIFPIKFVRDPMQGLLLLNVLLTGFTFYTSIIVLPQRFQAVNDVSASRAGVLLLTLTLTLPCFSLIAGAVLAKKPQMTFFLLLIATSLILTGAACFSDLPAGHAVSPRQYGFEVLMGSGLGMISTTQYVTLKIIFPERDTAVGTGAMNMLRAMGGCIGLAVCDAMLSSRLDDDLPAILPGNPERVWLAKNSLHSAASALSAEELMLVRRVYGRGYDDGFRVMIAFAGANVVVACLLFAATYSRGGVEKIVGDAKAEEEARLESQEG
ncbi:major facilitator superfamily-domain-containing protein [Aspergillus varians]